MAADVFTLADLDRLVDDWRPSGSEWAVIDDATWHALQPRPVDPMAAAARRISAEQGANVRVPRLWDSAGVRIVENAG